LNWWIIDFKKPLMNIWSCSGVALPANILAQGLFETFGKLSAGRSMEQGACAGGVLSSFAGGVDIEFPELK